MSVESLDITLAKVIWTGADKFNPSGAPKVIARTAAGRTVIGSMRKPSCGERYRLWGSWQLQKARNGYPGEEAFVFDHHEVVIEQNESGIAHFLSQHIDGIGPVRAKAIVAAFGAETLTVLRQDPEKALAVEGITPEVIDSIARYWEENPRVDPVAYARLIELFAAHKFPRRIVNSLIRDFGSDAPQVVTERPYLLLAFPGLGWAKVDEFATTTAKYPKDGIFRHKAALVEALERIASHGHTWGARVDVEREAFALINARPTKEAWEAALSEALIVERQLRTPKVFIFAPILPYCLPKLADAEETIAARLATLAALGHPLGFSVPTEGLNEGQCEAARLIESEAVVILKGPPGTGKTYLISRILKACIENDYRNVKVVAPTGKAAKRAADLIERALPGSPIPCSTIHKALSPIPSEAPEGIPASESKVGRGRSEFGFGRGEDNPIEADLIIVDECSMVDISLGASLLRAVSNGTRLIFVGDPNQLPSIGPGSMLRDLIAAEIPTANLTEIQRNSGRIVKACHAILKGELPAPSERVDIEAGENWIHLEISEPLEIEAQIVALHESAARNGKFNPLWDIQVIGPEKKKEGVGCDGLNRKLSVLLNDYQKINPDAQDDSREPTFKRGDKIIRVKNGLVDLLAPAAERDSEGTYYRWDERLWEVRETAVVNGDMGVILDIRQEPQSWYVVVQFLNPDRLCRLTYGDSHIQLAYAITTHKAQGSGIPYVICPVHNSFYFDPKTQQGLWNREMIYTMMSRAEKLLVTVGPFAAIETAIARKTIERRKTRLAGLVTRSFAPQETAAAEEVAHAEV